MSPPRTDKSAAPAPPGAFTGLEAAERFAHELLTHVPHAAVIVFDVRMRLRFAAGDVMRRLGFRSEDVVGRTAAEVLPGPMWKRLKHLYDRILAGETYVTDYESTGGRAYRMHGSPVLAADGRIAGGMLVSHEVVTPVEERLTGLLRQQSAVAQLGKLAVTGGVELAALIEEAARLIAETLETDGVGVVELVGGGREYVVRHESSGRLTGRRVPLEGSTPEAVLRTRGPVVVEDSDSGDDPVSAPLLAMGVKSAVCVPIGHVDHPFGMLTAFSRRTAAFSPDDAKFLETVAFVLAEAARREDAEAELRRQAVHDVVTGLPNRTLLDDRLRQSLAVAERAGLRVAVLFIDLDHFKVINDSLGHQAGDRALQVVAQRLQAAVRSSDTVARFGGDEFVVVATAVERVEDAVHIGETVLAQIASPIVIGDQPVYVRASVGICVAGAGDAADPQELIRAADAALYRAKARGRGRYELVDPDSRPALPSDHVTVGHELREALAAGDLRLVFQPFVRLDDGAALGAEVLLRWEHPTRGHLEPGDFIDVAEHSGLIVPIGAWMLHEACRHAARWHRAQEEFLLTVNVSARQLADPDIVATVEHALRESRLTPQCLGLELTEQFLIGDVAEVHRTLTRLKELGVLLLLDDFGTGFSSLSHLKRFPIDMVKIDRSFVEGLDLPSVGADAAVGTDDAAIISALVGMSRATGKQIIPEGIETAHQVAELKRLGCDSGQGYFFSSPMSLPDFEAWINARGTVVPRA